MEDLLKHNDQKREGIIFFIPGYLSWWNMKSLSHDNGKQIPFYFIKFLVHYTF